jgi:hypothetical protein
MTDPGGRLGQHTGEQSESVSYFALVASAAFSLGDYLRPASLRQLNIHLQPKRRSLDCQTSCRKTFPSSLEVKTR